MPGVGADTQLVGKHEIDAALVLRCYHNAYFFFFQAEDGIRDDLVTGVQTCALPISIAQAKGAKPKSTKAAKDKRAPFLKLAPKRMTKAIKAITNIGNLSNPASYEATRSEEHTSELQSPDHLVCRLLLEKKKKNNNHQCIIKSSHARITKNVISKASPEK